MSFAALFSFQGRLNRSKLWLLVLASIAVGMAIEVFAALFGAPANQGGDMAIGFVAMVVGLAVAVVNLSFQVRRCHDRGRSGWFLLLWCLPILNIWGLIELYFLSGTPGPNRFGPDPLGRGFARQAEMFR